jgi:hypothetical protein
MKVGTQNVSSDEALGLLAPLGTDEKKIENDRNGDKGSEHHKVRSGGLRLLVCREKPSNRQTIHS